MIDPIKFNKLSTSPKIATTALALSVVPGLGRVYAGRKYDGLLSFVIVIGFSAAGYSAYQNGEMFTASFCTSIGILFWIADFYGAYRSALISPK